MFTLNFKGEPNPKNEKLVKLEAVFYKSGHSRVTKSLKDITGYFKDWDEENQNFRPSDDESQKKNKILFEMKEQYIQVASEWEAQGFDWKPVQWKYCFSGINKTNKSKESKMKSLSQIIDHLIEKFSKKERIKNGKIVVSKSNEKEYKILKGILSEFVKKHYNIGLHRVFFADIDNEFLTHFVKHLQDRGKKMGNNGAVSHRMSV